MRFACVSDAHEYRDLLCDQATTSAWYFDQPAPIDAASREAFELVQLSVNGKVRTIRRTERNGAQLCTASLRPAAMNGEPVTVAYTYRVLVQRHGHVLSRLPRPTKGLKVQFSYGDADIRRVTPRLHRQRRICPRRGHTGLRARAIGGYRVRRLDLPAVRGWRS